MALSGTRREHGALREHLVEQLRGEIIDGRLESGAPLRTEVVMERFGVSNSPLREAFAQLASEGLVEVRRNRGAIVTSLTHEIATDVVRVASLHWETAFAWATPRLVGSDLSAVRRASVDFGRHVAEGDTRAARQASEHFDHLVLQRCGSDELQATIAAAQPRVSRVLHLVAWDTQLDKKAWVQAETLKAASESDGDRAAAAVRLAWTALSEALDHAWA